MSIAERTKKVVKETTEGLGRNARSTRTAAWDAVSGGAMLLPSSFSSPPLGASASTPAIMHMAMMSTVIRCCLRTELDVLSAAMASEL
jgi:hypothetical protein